MGFGIPIISIGNLLVGGTGKTPVTIALARDVKNSAILLRGYARSSKGLHIVSQNGNIKVDVSVSGDEAMVLAKALSDSTVIVCEDRISGIKKAKELGAKVIFLDDGFSQYHIMKYNILIRPKDEPTNVFCLPSGGYREPKMMYAMADMVLQDGKDFKRVVTFSKNGTKVDELPKNILLLTAISKPNRLLEFLPKQTEIVSFEDHHSFTQNEIDEIMKKYTDYAIVTTHKDFVKLEKFNLKDLYLMDLEIEFAKEIKLPLD